MESKEIGHQFLARLGKKRLRPGGLEATTWLISQGDFSQDKKVLEIACNRCFTAIELAKKYHCHIEAIDLDKSVLKKAQENIKKSGLEDLIHVRQANALKLPFEDNSFDIVINEAMLTMLSPAAKDKAIKEYYRVLKPGGILLTHDVAYLDEKTEKLIDSLRETIHINVAPLQVKKWEQLFKENGFQKVISQFGDMSLMTTRGMIKDEGFLNTIRIVRNGLRTENRKMFLKMRKFFTKTGKDLCYIVVASQK